MNFAKNTVKKTLARMGEDKIKGLIFLIIKNLCYGDIYELKACVNMTHSNMDPSEYKTYLISLENKLKTLLEQGGAKE